MVLLDHRLYILYVIDSDLKVKINATIKTVSTSPGKVITLEMYLIYHGLVYALVNSLMIVFLIESI